jgi:tetratricopeptide (TPR) repeat protein
MTIGLNLVIFCLLLLSSKLNAQNTGQASVPSDDLLRVELLHKMAEQRVESDTLLSISYAKEALQISKKAEYVYGEAMSYYLLGRVYGTTMQRFEKGIACHERSISLIEKTDSVNLLALNHHSIGQLFNALGRDASALNHLLKSLNAYKDTGNVLQQSFVQVNIASIYGYWSPDSYDQAMEYYNSAIRRSEEMKNDHLFVFTAYHLSTTLLLHGKGKEAEQYLLKAIPLEESTADSSGILAGLYANLGEAILQRGDIAGAVQHFKKSGGISERRHDPAGMARATYNMGQALQKAGRFADAESSYLKALEQYKNLRMTKMMIQVCGSLADAAKEGKRFEQAFHFRTLQYAYEDSTCHDQRRSLLSEMQTNTVRMSREKELELRKKDKQINDLYIGKLVIVVLALCLITLLYFNRQRLRIAKDKAELSKEMLLLEKELENKKLEEDQLKQKLEFNAKTLTANTLNLIQKNEILEKIKTKADEIKKSSAADLPARINNLMNTVNFALNIDKDWENFRMHFEQVHNNFFENLKARYPDLNSNDLRLCALLRLKLDTKEIATIMDISPESVKVARSRLRKKLQLAPSNNLSSFITQV